VTRSRDFRRVCFTDGATIRAEDDASEFLCVAAAAPLLDGNEFPRVRVRELRVEAVDLAEERVRLLLLRRHRHADGRVQAFGFSRGQDAALFDDRAEPRRERGIVRRVLAERCVGGDFRHVEAVHLESDTRGDHPRQHTQVPARGAFP
jgi:hypothetical protein